MKTKKVLITGASTGIGLVTAQHLHQRGYHVYGSVRKTEDAESLKNMGIHPLLFDVRNPQQIQSALAEVDALDALVNNAGIAFPSPLEFTPHEEAEAHFAVNVLGALSVTQACLPLLRQSQGRIIQMSSMGGRNAAPYFGIYCASKFALEGMSDALRLELRPWNIKVIILEPGAIDTPIWGKSSREADYPPQAKALYGKALYMLEKIIPKTTGLAPQKVAEVVEEALKSPRPKTRYVMDNASRLRAFLEQIPTPLRDWAMARYFKIS